MRPQKVASSGQCRAARALLGWTQQHLSALAGVTRSTITGFEAGSRRLHARTQLAITQIFESSGVAFIWLDGMEGVSVVQKQRGNGRDGDRPDSGSVRF